MGWKITFVNEISAFGFTKEQLADDVLEKFSDKDFISLVDKYTRDGTLMTAEAAEEFHAELQTRHFERKREMRFQREHEKEKDAVVAHGD